MYNKTYKRQNCTFITNGAGFVELMKSPAVQSMVEEAATQRANALNDGAKTYRVTVKTIRDRCVAHVDADSYEARLSNLKNNDLARAIR